MQKTLRLLRQILAIGVIALGGTLVAQPAAHATPFPELWLADSAGHAYCFVANFDNYPEHRSRVHWGMDRLDDQTQMTDIFESCAPGTDIWFSRVDLPGNDRGQTSCQRWLAGEKCDSAVIWIDFIEINEGSWDVEDQQKTVVHEIGHSIGLGHHSPSAHNCAMYVGEIPSNDLQWRSYHSHDVGHINAQY
ncbi:hypothetical protein [Phytohabitans rumicis]|uniref:hypothetical protein n=1 Tax=Phytohabitans rumicis TaxID=1076125 RepID=UPI0031E5DD54